MLTTPFFAFKSIDHRQGQLSSSGQHHSCPPGAIILRDLLIAVHHRDFLDQRE
jgi:hypothetical protein